MPDTPTAQALIDTLKAAIGPFAGVLAASLVAIRQLRTQRAYDRRLEWYERATAAVDDLSERLERHLEGPPGPAPHLPSLDLSEIRDAARNVILVAPQARLYAPRATFSRALYACQKVTPFAAGRPPAPGSETWKAAYLELRELYFQLADEVRHPLGLDPLQPTSVRQRPSDARRRWLARRRARRRPKARV